MPEKTGDAAVSAQVTAVVIDRDAVRLLAPLNAVDATTLWSCLADDPAEWNDIALLWPRYRSHEGGSELAESLPIRAVALHVAVEAVQEADAWVGIDLVGKRLVTEGNCPRLCSGRTPVETSNPPSEVTVLPPWWQRLGHNDLSVFSQSRGQVSAPDPHREVLWGSAMTHFFAQRMLRTIRQGEAWKGQDWEGNPCGRHEQTCAVHRDWLMTPRQDLEGGTPRDRLHLAKDWISDLADGRQFRGGDAQDPVPIPTELSTYSKAPMGRTEVILYFDACRETIESGWRWLLDHPASEDDPDLEQRLSTAMDAFLSQWLDQPFEDGPSPSEIIRCERVRIPLIAGDDDHRDGCDCPICEMLASGMFGPAYIQFDGHHLELDDDFAFSLCATREEWEDEQCAMAEFDSKLNDAAQSGTPESGPQERLADDDEFGSVWRHTYVSDEGIPGDTHGLLGLAFFVAEMGATLSDLGADQSDLDELNAAFRAVRLSAETDAYPVAIQTFKQTLESLCGKHAGLVSRGADLQSRLDEQLRAC